MPGKARRGAVLGEARRSRAGLGTARQAGIGMAWRGSAGRARLGQCKAWSIRAGHGKAGKARRGKARRGVAERGVAWQELFGKAGQGPFIHKGAPFE